MQYFARINSWHVISLNKMHKNQKMLTTEACFRPESGPYKRGKGPIKQGKLYRKMDLDFAPMKNGPPKQVV